MTLPAIDLGSLPTLGTDQGLYGSQPTSATSMDDRTIIVMVYVYDVGIGPEGA